MRIYEIDQAIEALLGQIDEETGEVLFDPELLEELQMERERKVENLALAWKNLAAEAKAIKAEEEALAKRRKATENEAERARKYLEYVLGGESYKSARVAVSYRRSESVEIGPEFVPWAFEHRQNLLRMKEPEADKTAIKAALKAGEEIPFTEITQKKSMQIK
jgi:tetratricopeptide (TPR) repeat protein